MLYGVSLLEKQLHLTLVNTFDITASFLLNFVLRAIDTRQEFPWSKIHHRRFFLIENVTR